MLYDNFMRLKMNNLPKYGTSTGYPCNFNSKNIILKNYRIYGNNVDGEFLGDKTANLCDVSQKIHRNGNYSYSEANQEFIIKWINATAGIAYKMSVKPSTKYTVYYDVYSTKIESSSSSNLQFAYDLNSASTGYITRIYVTADSLTEEKHYQSTYTFTTKDTAEELYIYISCFQEILRGRLMVAESESITEYEPFGYKIPIKLNDSVVNKIYLYEPLRKYEDAADYIDFHTQKLNRYVSASGDGLLEEFTESNILLPSISAALGSNTITTDTIVPPSNILAKYVK